MLAYMLELLAPMLIHASRSAGIHGRYASTHASNLSSIFANMYACKHASMYARAYVACAIAYVLSDVQAY